MGVRLAVTLSPGAGGVLRLEEQPSEQVADPEEHEDHDRDDQRHEPDHGQEARLIRVLVHSVEARSTGSDRTRSATK